jgi:molybdopterin molybdotransferase
LIASWSGEPNALAATGDDEAAIADAISAAGGDLIVTIGGASVGDHDLVKPALARLGLQLEVESVAMRPGKPTWFGVLGDGRPVLGLPGNPASALVCAELFLRPLLFALQGADPARPPVAARTTRAIAVGGQRESWLRARLDYRPSGELEVTPFEDQDSSLINVFAAADSLIRRPAGALAAEAGDVVETLRLDRL